MASPTGESSNQEDSNCQLEPLEEGTLDRHFETFQEWNAELNRLKSHNSPLNRGPEGISLIPFVTLSQGSWIAIMQGAIAKCGSLFNTIV